MVFENLKLSEEELQNLRLFFIKILGLFEREFSLTLGNFLFIEMKSEAVKILKAEYLLKAIVEHKMDQAIIFCRTKLDCDHTEQYLINKGGGR